MYRNLICIDSDKIHHSKGADITLKYKDAIVPTPCTLTDAVEKYGRVTIGEQEGLHFVIYGKERAEDFKENHLYKEETLEDGIYEAERVDGKSLFFVKGGKYGRLRDDITHDLKYLHNPRKIAEL